MDKLPIDYGIIELDIGGNGNLRFNPADPNLYKRLFDFAQELQGLEEQCMTGSGETYEGTGNDAELHRAGAMLDGLEKLDHEIKQRLTSVFGTENDFEQILSSVSLMAISGNGERVITNLLNGLMPYLEKGIKRHMSETASLAVKEAKKNRTQRRGNT